MPPRKRAPLTVVPPAEEAPKTKRTKQKPNAKRTARNAARPQEEKDAAQARKAGTRAEASARAREGNTYERNPLRSSVPRPRTVVYDKASHEAAKRGMTLEEFVETLSPEELAKGKLLSSAGDMRGRASAYVPRAFHDACIRELLKRGEQLYRNHFIAAIEMFAEIANDETADPKDRLKAGQYIIERVQGKVPDKVEHSVADPWQTIIDGIIAEVPDEIPDKAGDILRAAKKRFENKE